ncbi:MAG TPA: hypothetical protein VH374_15485 [Polyangia bacterium]|nr:hypothetical protein [Polyangia bacterium]
MRPILDVAIRPHQAAQVAIDVRPQPRPRGECGARFAVLQRPREAGVSLGP